MNESISVEDLPVEGLTRFSDNARKHTPEQIDKIAASIAAFGLTSDDPDSRLPAIDRLEGFRPVSDRVTPAASTVARSRAALKPCRSTAAASWLAS